MKKILVKITCYLLLASFLTACYSARKSQPWHPKGYRKMPRKTPPAYRNRAY